MTEKEKYDDSLDFVTGHYCPGAFRPLPLAKLLHINVRTPLFRRRTVAAACVASVLIACAGIGTYIYIRHEAPAATPAVETTIPMTQPVSTAKEIKRITFNDTPLAEVVKEIEKVYDVRLTSLPEEEYRLTLSYEGTAEDLVATINELLGTHIEIEK